MEIREWIKAFCEENNMSQRKLSRKLGYRNGGITSGAATLVGIIQEFKIRPDDLTLDSIVEAYTKNRRNMSQNSLLVLKTARSLPIWMPNGKEEKAMSKPETTRGNTMLKIAEKPEPSTEEKGIGETTLLLRRIKANRQELRDLESYKEPESQAVQPKSVYERIKSRLVKQKEQEVIEQAKWQAKAELVQGLLLDEKRLTSLRLEQHKASLEKFAKHEQSILSELASLQAKITSQQNELNMLAWSLDNAFAYVVMEDVKDGDC